MNVIMRHVSAFLVSTGHSMPPGATWGAAAGKGALCKLYLSMIMRNVRAFSCSQVIPRPAGLAGVLVWVQVCCSSYT